MSTPINHSKDRIAIVIARFNPEITGSLGDLCVKELLASHVQRGNIKVYSAPGAYELPFVAKRLAKSKKFDAVIAFGCVIKGETSHDVYVATWAAVGLGQVSLETGVPVLFGVLTPNTEEQALERAKPGPLDRGTELARAALEMIDIVRERI